MFVNNENFLPTPTHNIPCLMFRNFPFHMCDEMASGQDMGLLQITFLSYAGSDLIVPSLQQQHHSPGWAGHCSCWKVDVDYKNIWSSAAGGDGVGQAQAPGLG